MNLTPDTITKADVHRIARQLVESAATLYRMSDAIDRGECSPEEAIEIIDDALACAAGKPTSYFTDGDSYWMATGDLVMVLDCGAWYGSVFTTREELAAVLNVREISKSEIPA